MTQSQIAPSRRSSGVKPRSNVGLGLHNGFATAAGSGVNGAITPYLAVKPIQVEYVGTSRRSFRSLTKDGKGSNSARAEFGPDCGVTGLDHCAPRSFRSVANRGCAGHDDAGLGWCCIYPYAL